mmetsp:Transcript_91588/g.247491  ORF Transcript_91588/g.247491 Transcript_91588/m.247491 type:complete len:223 (-) Transcript_91588:103-771(-)
MTHRLRARALNQAEDALARRGVLSTMGAPSLADLLHDAVSTGHAVRVLQLLPVDKDEGHRRVRHCGARLGILQTLALRTPGAVEQLGGVEARGLCATTHDRVVGGLGRHLQKMQGGAVHEGHVLRRHLPCHLLGASPRRGDHAVGGAVLADEGSREAVLGGLDRGSPTDAIPALTDGLVVAFEVAGERVILGGAAALLGRVVAVPEGVQTHFDELRRHIDGL